ncbi:MAG: VOC family protein [Bdellovibrionota bacterium]
MFDHMNIHVADLKRSRAFYQAALTPLGVKANLSEQHVLFKDGETHFAIVQGPASQHLHLAFKAHSQKEVDEFYKGAMGNGGIDNGRPGPRDYAPGFYYAAFVIDPDGNNIEAAFRREK